VILKAASNLSREPPRGKAALDRLVYDAGPAGPLRSAELFVVGLPAVRISNRRPDARRRRIATSFRKAAARTPQSLFVGLTSCVAVACRAKEIQQRILAAIVGADASQPRPAAGSSVRPQHRAAQYGTVEVSVTSLRARARVSMSQTSLARGQLRSNMQGVCPRVTARHGVLRRQRSDADAARRPKLAAAE
jgi:hypothetical protein